MPKNRRKNKYCSNCKAEIGLSNFCQRCGQENTHRHAPFSSLMKDFLGDVFTFDSKFLKSFFPLLFRPGFLTEQYLLGKRISYILPFRVFIISTILFVLAFSVHKNIEKTTTAINDIESQNLNYQELYNTLNKIPNLNDSIQREISIYIFSHFTSQTIINQTADSVKQLFRKKLRQYQTKLEPIKLNELEKLYLARFKLQLRKNKMNPSYRETNLIAFNHQDLFSIYKKDLGFLDSLGNDFEFRSIDSKSNFILYSPTQVNLDSMNLLEKYIYKKSKYLEKQGSSGMDIFVKEIINQIPKIMFLLIPIFAFILKLLTFKRRIFYYDHLIFALHFHAFIFILLSILLLYLKWFTMLISIILIVLYLYFALLKIYKYSKTGTFFLFQGTLIIYGITLLFGMVLLLLVTISFI